MEAAGNINYLIPKLRRVISEVRVRIKIQLISNYIKNHAIVLIFQWVLKWVKQLLSYQPISPLMVRWTDPKVIPYTFPLISLCSKPLVSIFFVRIALHWTFLNFLSGGIMCMHDLQILVGNTKVLTRSFWYNIGSSNVGIKLLTYICT